MNPFTNGIPKGHPSHEKKRIQAGAPLTDSCDHELSADSRAAQDKRVSMKSTRIRFVLLGALALGIATLSLRGSPDENPFAMAIRSTPWRPPAEEQKSFHLPPGFEMQLVAAEPDINKPMNLAFDSKGRLWVSTSIEYPVAAPTNSPGRDRIMIFEDFGADGKARKATQFAGGLNIPMGLYPFQSLNADGSTTWKAVAWSIPHIWLFEDTDGDGRSDKQEVLYANFDYTRDTHGNQSSFRRGFDGWLYCAHGYNNDSRVKGLDGYEVRMNSGNTYRIRLRGERIEHHTYGQVNPFGLAFDEFGNLFASDCHSEPIYQLLQGAHYPSFGKPHDGLGFAPKMMENKRGSTAIAGISIYADVVWPEEFQENVFVGDVMTSRIYRDRLEDRGSTRIAQGLPDLVTSDDPWFRPVDIQLGPDGALYIADFYNRIIGHYEVPFTHPGRDRRSGRIWRLIHRGPGGSAFRGNPPDISKSSAEQLAADLARPNLIHRRLATDELTDRLGQEAIPALRRALSRPANSFQQVHALWALERLRALEEMDITSAAASPDRLVRTHAMRVIAASKEFNTARRGLAMAGLADEHGLVQRCAAEALANHPAFEHVSPLLDRITKAPHSDSHLLHVARKALRDQLVPEANLRRLATVKLDPEKWQIVADLCLSVNTPAAAEFLVSRLFTADQERTNSARASQILKHAATYASIDELGRLVQFASRPLPQASNPLLFQELGRQFKLFKALDAGLRQRGVPLPGSAISWGGALVASFFESFVPSPVWLTMPHEANPTATPWDVEPRPCSDGRWRNLISSFPHGDDLTGVLRSRPIEIPQKLEFWLAGQDGFSPNPPQHLNRIRLRAHPSGQVLAETFAPRSNIAHRVTWRLEQHLGTQGYIEAIDGDDSNDDAWLAFGDFQPAIAELRPPEFPPRPMLDSTMAAAEISARVQRKSVAPVLRRFCLPGPDTHLSEVDADVISACALAWVALEPDQAIPKLSAALNSAAGSALYRERLAQILASHDRADTQNAVLNALKTLPQKAHERLSYTLASAPFSAETLLAGLENGAVSLRVLHRVGLHNRLRASKPANWEARVAKLKNQLPASDDARDKLLVDYKAAAVDKPGNMNQGRQLFAKHCASCHRIGEEGALVGPQLDGIGQRGLDRLCEDILDPNRSVDLAFRTTLFTLKNGDLAGGLFRREEGDWIVLAESTGREISIPKKEIAERSESELSLMPENFGEILSKEDFAHLMAFLLRTAIGKLP